MMPAYLDQGDPLGAAVTADAGVRGGRTESLPPCFGQGEPLGAAVIADAGVRRGGTESLPPPGGDNPNEPGHTLWGPRVPGEP